MPAGQQAFKGPRGEPFTSDLSGQDFWTLLQAGYRPLEMVMGSCVYHVARQGPFSAMGNIGQNVELTNFSLALYEAREIAMERMQTEATPGGGGRRGRRRPPRRQPQLGAARHRVLRDRHRGDPDRGP